MAASVSYQATDLVDTTPGENLWQLDYTVSGSLAPFNAINLLFAPSSYSDINVVSNSVPALLDTAPVIQPDVGFGADGMLTLTALSNLGPSFTGKIGVTFVWSQSTTPGSQPFELLDDGFSVTGTGQTTLTSAVPEPEMLAMMLAGLVVVAGAARRRT